MKPLNALIASLLAGVATFSAQYFLFPPELHAAAFVVPRSSDWRQEMIDRDPGGRVVDRVLAHLTDKLDLSADQVKRFRPLLEKQHERILAVLLTSPATLTRDQFMAERQVIMADTHRQLDGFLTPDQLQIANESLRPNA